MAEEVVKKTRTKRIPCTRAERQKYAASLKKGKCIELLRPITQCTPADLGFADLNNPVSAVEVKQLTVGELCTRLNISAKDLVFKLVDHSEGIRDMSQVRDVMVEGDIRNGVIPVRCSPMVERVVTESIGFKTASE